MGRIIKSHDDLPVREYMDFLKQFNRLSDCSWFWHDDHEDRDRFTNHELALFRNLKGGFIEIKGDGDSYERINRSTFTISQTRLAAHRAARAKRRAVWVTNDSNHDTLLMLIDIDKKRPTSDVIGAAQYIVEKYLSGRGYVEMSTGGMGRHVYFFVDVRYCKRGDFNSAVKRWYGYMLADPTFASAFDVSFDPVPVYGIPTLWAKDQCDQ